MRNRRRSLSAPAKRGRPGARHRSAAAAALLAAALCFGAAAHAAERAVPGSAAELQLSFAPVVEAAAPAVVNIYTRRVVAQRRRGPFFDAPFFDRFFGGMFRGAPRERVENSLGSGVIVSPDGIVVTNAHVIEDSDEITVALADRREFEAEIVGSDAVFDLAVLRIDAGGEQLPALELGDSDAIRVGDIVLAIGNPFGVGQTVTSGIVSADVRTGVKGGAFIQTDAAINPGNSGGALVTLDGRLLGVNTAILSRSGGSVGIGFAIPANLVRVVVAGMAADGRMVRPWAGLEILPVTPDIARALGLERPTGVMVGRTHPASPAAVETGDVILAVDGREVFDEDSFRFRLSTRPLGETARLSVLSRSGRREEPLPIVAPPEDPPRDTRRLRGRHPFAGAVVANLSPALNRELELPPSASGVAVLRVERGPAARLGLRRGDIVLEIADRAVGTTAELTRALSRERGEWPIAIRRGREVLRVVTRVS